MGNQREQGPSSCFGITIRFIGARTTRHVFLTRRWIGRSASLLPLALERAVSACRAPALPRSFILPELGCGRIIQRPKGPREQLPRPSLGDTLGQVIQERTCDAVRGDNRVPEAAGRGRDDAHLRRLILLGRTLVLALLLVGLTSGVPAAQAASPDVLITEVQAANTRTVADDQGRYSDWIELHNPRTRPSPSSATPSPMTLPRRPSGPCPPRRWHRAPFWWSGPPA